MCSNYFRAQIYCIYNMISFKEKIIFNIEDILRVFNIFFNWLSNYLCSLNVPSLIRVSTSFYQSHLINDHTKFGRLLMGDCNLCISYTVWLLKSVGNLRVYVAVLIIKF